MRGIIYDGQAYFLELFTAQLTLIAIGNGLNTWNDKDFKQCIHIHQNTAKWN